MRGKGKVVVLAAALLLISFILPGRPGGGSAPGRPAAAGAAPPAPGGAHPETARGGDWSGALLKVGGACALVLALAGLCVFALSRLQGATRRAGGGRSLALVESLPVGGRKRLHLARIGERLVLLGETEKDLNLLLSLGEEPALPAAAAEPPGEAPAPFRRLLRGRVAGGGGQA
jgi:flagellar biogenesis protein FliO